MYANTVIVYAVLTLLKLLYEFFSTSTTVSIHRYSPSKAVSTTEALYLLTSLRECMDVWMWNLRHACAIMHIYIYVYMYAT